MGRRLLARRPAASPPRARAASSRRTSVRRSSSCLRDVEMSTAAMSALAGRRLGCPPRCSPRASRASPAASATAARRRYAGGLPPLLALPDRQVCMSAFVITDAVAEVRGRVVHVARLVPDALEARLAVGAEEILVREVEPADVDDADEHARAVVVVARRAEAALLCRRRLRACRLQLRGRTGQGLAELDAECPGLVAQLERPPRRQLNRAEVALGPLVVALDAERLLRLLPAGRVLGDPDEDAHGHRRRHVAQALGGRARPCPCPPSTFGCAWVRRPRRSWERP